MGMTPNLSPTEPVPRVRYFVLVFLLVLAGCEGIQINYVPLKMGTYLPRQKAENIPILTGTVDEPYEELGVILVRKYPGSEEAEMQEAFRNEAMTRGADAVIHMEVEKATVFSLSPFIFSLPFPGVEARGTAIRYKKEKG